MKIPKEARHYVQEQMEDGLRKNKDTWPEEGITWAIMLFREWQAKNPCWDCNSNVKSIACPGIKNGCKIREYRRRHI